MWQSAKEKQPNLSKQITMIDTMLVIAAFQIIRETSASPVPLNPINRPLWNLTDSRRTSIWSAITWITYMCHVLFGLRHLNELEHTIHLPSCVVRSMSGGSSLFHYGRIAASCRCSQMKQCFSYRYPASTTMPERSMKNRSPLGNLLLHHVIRHTGQGQHLKCGKHIW